MAGQLNINFHQTFKPEKQYIGDILNVANMAAPLSVQDISAYTGIPNGKSSGKVEPHIHYARYMGLIESEKKDGKYLLTRTKLGEIVYGEDPGLQEYLSVLLCHSMMLRKKNGADMWNAVFHKILPQYHMGIKKDLLIKELSILVNGKVNKKNFAPFIGSYEDMFSSIGILLVETENIDMTMLQFNKEYVFLYAYILFEYWDEIFSSQDEISSIQLEELNFGKTFGWDEQYEYNVLEHLSDKGIVRLNRQLVPFTILRLVDKDTVMEKIYSELC